MRSEVSLSPLASTAGKDNRQRADLVIRRAARGGRAITEVIDLKTTTRKPLEPYDKRDAIKLVAQLEDYVRALRCLPEATETVKAFIFYASTSQCEVWSLRDLYSEYHIEDAATRRGSC